MPCRFRLQRSRSVPLKNGYPAMLRGRDFRYYRPRWAGSSGVELTVVLMNFFQSYQLADLVFYFDF